jgi:SanA protein
MKILRKILTIVSKKFPLIILSVLFILISPIFYLQLDYRIIKKLNNENGNETSVIIIPGAGIQNGYPSSVLRYRLDKGIETYQSLILKNLKPVFLVSGDNRTSNYDEPKAMAKYLIENGIDPDDIVKDFGGRRTIDTCKRAKEVFKVDKAYLISQEFHLPRFTYLCEKSGIESIPISAKDMVLTSTIYQYVREIGSSWLTIFEANFYDGYTKSDGTERKLNK